MIVGRTGNLTRSEIIEVVCARTQLKKPQVEDLVCAVFDSMVAALATNREVEIRGFGSFRYTVLGERTINVPGKGLVVVSPRIKINFRPGQELEKLMNAPEDATAGPVTQPLSPEADQSAQ